MFHKPPSPLAGTMIASPTYLVVTVDMEEEEGEITTHDKLGHVTMYQEEEGVDLIVRNQMVDHLL